MLDIDDTFDAVHGSQQLRLFNAHYDKYGFQPIAVFDGEGRFVSADHPYEAALKSVPLIRADSHYASPLVNDWSRANGVDFILGAAPTTTLRRRVGNV